MLSKVLIAFNNEVVNVPSMPSSVHVLTDVFFLLIYAMFSEENVLSSKGDKAEQPDDTPGRLEQHEGQVGVARAMETEITVDSEGCLGTPPQPRGGDMAEIEDDQNESIYLDMESAKSPENVNEVDNEDTLGSRQGSQRHRRTELERLGGVVLESTLRSRTARLQ